MAKKEDLEAMTPPSFESFEKCPNLVLTACAPTQGPRLYGGEGTLPLACRGLCRRIAVRARSLGVAQLAAS